jgi:hypothetical protein
MFGELDRIVTHNEDISYDIARGIRLHAVHWLRLRRPAANFVQGNAVQQFKHYRVTFLRVAFAGVLYASAGPARASGPAGDRCTPCDRRVATVAAVPGHPGWERAQSRNFSVLCHRRAGNATAIAEQCEKLRTGLCERWFPSHEVPSWKPPCEIIVHQNSASYLQAVGRGASNTSGSADVKTEHGNVVSRRVDLRADRANLLTAALPHEMRHVVMADWTQGKPLPRWADEGMAMLADPDDKRARHARDLDAAVRSRSAFSAVELLSLDDYPAQDRWPAFYAQSHALVDYLVKQDSPERFIEFLRSAEETGYDSALQEHYNIRTVGALRLAWRETGKHRAVSMRR